MSTRPHVIVASTEFFAPGGVQYVSRQAVAALKDVADVQAWALCDRAVPPGDPLAGVRFRFASGRDWQMGRWATTAAMTNDEHSVLLLMHLNLAPIAVPWLASGRRVVIFLHGVEAWRRLSRPQQFVLSRADLLANSRYTAAKFAELNPELAHQPVRVCALGVADLATTTDEAASPKIALTVSRLSAEDRYKGHDRLIRLWPAVRAQVPGATLVIVGDGDDRQRLEALARDVVEPGAVRFAGRVSEADLVGWYSRSAFFVLLSGREGFGLVFLEAMRAARACVTVSGAQDAIIEDGVTGLIVDADDQRATDAVVRLFRDPQLRDELGANGRRRFLAEFTLERFSERLRALVVGAGTTDRAA
jgi:phosphatidylinositol alpha-1,6-mannosyltransferase